MPTNKLNSLVCEETYGNTGQSDCDIVPGLIVAHILIPRGYKFLLADTVDSDALIAAIQAGLTDDDKNQRFYYFGQYEAVTPRGGSPTEESLGYGLSRQVRRAVLGDDYTMIGGMNLHKEQFKFSGKHKQFDVLAVDDNNVIWGRKAKDNSGNTVLAGYTISNLYVGDYVRPDGSKGESWMISYNFQDSKQVNETFAYMQLDENPFDDGTGFITAELQGSSTGPTNLTIKANTSYGTDLHDLYATELAATTAVIVRNKNTKNGITVTAAASNSTGWTYTLAATGVDPDNPGTGGKVLVKYAAPSVLNGLNVPGIESDEITVTLS